MRVRTKGTNIKSAQAVRRRPNSLRSTSRMNSTTAIAIPTHAPRDMVNRQAKHMTKVASHAASLSGFLSV